MRAGVSTSLRSPDMDAEAIAALCERLGPELVALDDGIPPALWAPLARRLLADVDERPVEVVYAPSPAPELGRGQRRPALASADRDERQAAVALVGDTVARARDLAARVVVLPAAGRVPIPARAPRISSWVAQGFLDPDAGRPAAREVLAAWREQRARAVGPALDGLRFALEALAREAERRGLCLALPNVARYDEIPTRDEALRLVADLAGAPFGLWLDTAAAHAKEVVGLGTQEGYVRALVAAGAPLYGATVADAAGLLGGLPAGRGEIDLPAIVASLPPGAPCVVACHPSVYEDEAASAIALVQAIVPGSGRG